MLAPPPRAALKRLELSWNQDLCDAAVLPLAAMTHLTHLDLAYCDQVGPMKP